MIIKKYFFIIIFIIILIGIASAQKIYVIPYVGDIDGSVSEDWFQMYEKLLEFYDRQNIPAGFSFFPGTLNESSDFLNIFLRIYFSKNIELIQKGYLGDEREMNMDKLSLQEQEQIIRKGQGTFINEMKKNGINNPKPIISYDQIHGRVNEDNRKIMENLGFKIYFDVFREPDLGFLQSTNNFDSYQYGIGFTKNGDVGRETKFKSRQAIIKEIKNFKDARVFINGDPVIPLWVHHEDFEDAYNDNQIDLTKWNIYYSTLRNLKNNPLIEFLTPTKAYELIHQNIINNTNSTSINDSAKEICQYAYSAGANSENILGSSASYAIGSPDAEKKSCTEWSGYGFSWTPSNWNVKGTIKLNYKIPVYVKNIKIFGDYDICWDRIWIKNSINGEEKQILNGPNNECIFERTVSEKFLADTIIIETCGWSWSSLDSAQLCGIQEAPKTSLEICNWKNCKKGALSISFDDGELSCLDKLENNRLKGTFFLSETNIRTKEYWNKINQIFVNGHEIGTHTREHWCVDKGNFKQDVSNNINDIVSNTIIKKGNLISHAYPCGFVTEEQKNLLKTNWNFLSARGYNFNSLEEPVPNDFFNLKTYNSIGYPGGSLEPENYNVIAKNAEEKGKWANLIFHSECDDQGVIGNLKNMDLWVDTIGNVIKYIKLREDSKIYDYAENSNGIGFKIKSDLNNSYYRQDLTLRLKTEKKPAYVYVDGVRASFTYKNNYLIFNVKFPINHGIEIIF